MRISPNLTVMTAESADLGRLVKARLFDGRGLGLIAGRSDDKYFVELEGHDASFPQAFRIKTDFSVAAYTGLLELRIAPDSIVVEDTGHWRKPGYLVLTGSTWLLPAKDQVTGTCYYDFETGSIVGEPENSRYAIAHSWSLHVVDEAAKQSLKVYSWPRR